MSKINLPVEYLNNMKKALGEEFEAFLLEYEKEPWKALRFNTKKVRPETIEKLKAEWKLDPVEWCEDAFRYEESGNLRPGLSPYHDAGVYYIQEPSAMITAEKAEINDRDIVLDLCAAPGGKSTQAAAKCKWIVSNEPIANRARILSSNFERMGFANAVVCSAFPDKLASCFHEFFTRIIVDAPCSGEGMMRKDETAVSEWSPANVALCIERQEEILESAAQMLKPGGRLVYSTCTFEYGENQGQMEHFLELHPEFHALSMETMYPHQIKGEGHFCAVLEKDGDITAEPSKKNRVNELSDIAKMMQKKKIHVLRCGIEPGEMITDKKGNKRYEPSHAEALSGSFGNEKDYLNLHSLSDADRYLKGNVLELSDISDENYELSSKGGWLTVKYDGYPMGLGKLTGTTVKNHYPKGLRHY